MSILNMVWWWKKWGNIWEPLNLTVTTSWLDATIKWEDNEIWTIPPTTFQKSELVRKIGSAPTSPSDWVLVVTETVKDTYKTTWYVDQWLTDWETYYYRVFSYSDLGGISYCDAVNVTPSAWWQPWVNTLLYCPLNSTDTYTDQSGNNVQTTSSWVSFWMYQWVDCAYFDFKWSHKILIPAIAWTFPNMTMSVWSYMTNNDAVTQIFMTEWNNTNLSLQPSSSWQLQSQTYDGTDHYITDGNGLNAWHHNLIVWDYWTSYFYVDWQLIWGNSGSSITNMYISDGALWWHSQNNSSIFAYWWYLSKAILEDKTRTAQEISDYYDQTKADYWIS